MPYGTVHPHRFGPKCPLPLPPTHTNVENYVESLLDFVASSDLMQLLCGGVHILDFFTQEPDLYTWLLSEKWREWFDLHDLQDVLDFLLREDVASMINGDMPWRGKPAPPADLVEFVHQIRSLSLDREFVAQSGAAGDIPIHTAVGMKLKKIHEVDNFARYIQNLTQDIAHAKQQSITHLVDFGSGQNYLGRTLASPPYSKHVIAVESRPHNIDGAKAMDITAKLAPRVPIIVNKKQHRKDMEAAGIWKSKAQMRAEKEAQSTSGEVKIRKHNPMKRPKFSSRPKPELVGGTTDTVIETSTGRIVRAKVEHLKEGNGSIQYVEHRLEDGNLAAVIDEIVDESSKNHSLRVMKQTGAAAEDSDEQTSVALEKLKMEDPKLMVISIHSCGNLTHHGLRSIVLNPSVTAVALIGCCYNLVSERLTPPSYKHPILQPQEPETSNDVCVHGAPGDPHGFPMSERVCNFPTPTGTGLNLNITARMMAVQAPLNWTPDDSDSFFTRHFYRALLQRVFLDHGVVNKPVHETTNPTSGGSPAGAEGGSTQPIIIGSLRKGCYVDFVSYVRGALEKLTKDPERGGFFQSKLGRLSDEDIRRYAVDFGHRKKQVSIVWSLMAYSAALVEAVIVVDRWCWLSEQSDVGECWVEPVFDYAQSPRNLVVVGIKK